MDKYDKNDIVTLVNDIIDRFDYYSYLDDAEKEAVDILNDAVIKIKAIKL